MSFVEKDYLRRSEKTPLLTPEWLRNDELEDFLGHRRRRKAQWAMFVGATAVSIMVLLGIIGLIVRFKTAVMEMEIATTQMPFMIPTSTATTVMANISSQVTQNSLTGETTA